MWPEQLYFLMKSAILDVRETVLEALSGRYVITSNRGSGFGRYGAKCHSTDEREKVLTGKRQKERKGIWQNTGRKNAEHT